MPRQNATVVDTVSNVNRLRVVFSGGEVVVKRRGIALYSLADVASAAGVSRQTIYNWLAASPPVVEFSYKLGGAPVFTRAELEAAKRIAASRRARIKSLRLSKAAGAQ